MKVQYTAWILSSLLLGFAAFQLVICDEGGSEGEGSGNDTLRWDWNLTGIPQIDYVHDPNLPRELNGYNLSTYPFFNKIPKNINFSCDGLKDGFYASVEHGCQLYHHCLFGTRYDFLCANYTAFDQRTFICQFVSEVDCPNSGLYFHRNDALYKATSTTTQAPVVIYVGAGGRRIRPAALPPRDEIPSQRPQEEEGSGKQEERRHDFPRHRDRGFSRRRNRRRCGPGRRRRCRRPRPRPDYYDYYDYDDYYESDGRNPKDREYDYEYYDTDDGGSKIGKTGRNKLKDYASEARSDTSTPPPVPKAKAIPVSPPTARRIEGAHDRPIDPTVVAANREKIFSKGRAPPKIRPPVPIHEKRKYNGFQGRAPQTPSTSTEAPPPPVAQEYEDYYYEEVEAPSFPQRNNGYLPTVMTTSSTTTPRPTTTTTTQPPPTPMDLEQYYYDYDDYEVETSTTLRPRSFAGATRNFGPRRYQQQRQESQVEQTRRTPGIEHQKINEALETPSQATLRIPYHNKPRPSFARSTQVPLPVTTVRTTTSTTPRIDPITTTENPGIFDPFERIHRRFPVFEMDTRLPLETVSAAERQRKRGKKTKQYISVAPTPESNPEQYLGFEEPQARDEEAESYNQNQRQPSTAFEVSSMRSFIQRDPMSFTRQRHFQNPASTLQTYVEQQPRQRQTYSRRQPHYANPQSTVASRPEYISLLSDDEEEAPYRERSRSPLSRFSSPRSRQAVLSGAAQEIYPSYLPTPFTPSIMNEYMNSNSVRRQSGFPRYVRANRIPYRYPAYDG